MYITELVRKITKPLGFSVERFPFPNLKRRLLTYNNFKIDILIDVGANAGQYSSQIRELGYKGRIISYEPTSAAFKLLQKKTRKDNKWDIYQMAIGSAPGEIEINVSGNSFSSSILDMEPAHLENAPESKYVKKEIVPINTLDNLFDDLIDGGGNVFLKIDTQGYEAEVLKGVEKNLSRISCIQLETSFVSLYSGETLFEDMITLLHAKGFEIYTIEPEFYNTSTGRLLQADIIFYNREIQPG